jgi:hypothetical protein
MAMQPLNDMLANSAKAPNQMRDMRVSPPNFCATRKSLMDYGRAQRTMPAVLNFFIGRNNRYNQQKLSKPQLLTRPSNRLRLRIPTIDFA